MVSIPGPVVPTDSAPLLNHSVAPTALTAALPPAAPPMTAFTECKTPPNTVSAELPWNPPTVSEGVAGFEFARKYDAAPDKSQVTFPWRMLARSLPLKISENVTVYE